MSHRRLAVATCVAVILALGIVFAGPPIPAVTIEVPGFPGYTVPLVTDGAWPLTINMQANSPIGVATYAKPPMFPQGEQETFIVWADPDNCWSLSLWGKPDGEYPALRCPNFNDETYLEFTPAINLPNLVKETDGFATARELGGRPSVVAYSYPADTNGVGTNSTSWEVGPFVGDAPNGLDCGTEGGPRCDNYGFGASPNIPGLVILSDRGVGLVWDGEAGPSGTARNLAGFVNSVSWLMNDCLSPKGCSWGRSGVTAHMKVPSRLFAPIVRMDIGHYNNVKAVGRYYQLDGGSWVQDENMNLLSVLRQMVTTVRIFVVSGKAPDEISDINGDGVIDSRDLPSNYKLLSNETIVRFRTYCQIAGINPPQAGLGIPFDYILDGMDHIVAPTGGGGITELPR